LPEGIGAVKLPANMTRAALPVVQNANSSDAPAWSPENVLCLRDCKHFLHIVTHFEHGNPAGTFENGYLPKRHRYYCMRIPGIDLELTADEPILGCNLWDPMSAGDRANLKLRQEKWQPKPPEPEPPEVK
jgi:hypothetical protein